MLSEPSRLQNTSPQNLSRPPSSAPSAGSHSSLGSVASLPETPGISQDGGAHYSRPNSAESITDRPIGSHSPEPTPGLRLDNRQAPKSNNPVDNKSYQELQQQGNQCLESAKKAFTRYGELNLAEQSKNILSSFYDVCNNPENQSSPKSLVSALKAISLPPDAPKELAITIQYKEKPVLSLIPPGEKDLNDMSIEDIKEHYEMAFQAMGMWSNTHAQGANPQQALDDLNKTLATLKTLKDALNKKQHDQTGQPGNCSLEILYQQHVDRGISIHFEAKDDIELRDHFKKMLAKGKIPSPDMNAPQEPGASEPTENQ